MNFDRIARFYASLEYLVFGRSLQQVRCSHLAYLAEVIPLGAEVLVVGDGDGRFFVECVQAWPNCRFVYVERSQNMLRKARQRINREGIDADIRWCHGDALLVGEGKFDVLVTHFVLDCHQGKALESFVQKLAEQVKCKGFWMVSDFDPAATWWSSHLVSVMYMFFACVASLPRQHLKRPDALIQAQSFSKQRHYSLWQGFIFSDLWRRLE